MNLCDCGANSCESLEQSAARGIHAIEEYLKEATMKEGHRIGAYVVRNGALVADYTDTQRTSLGLQPKFVPGSGWWAVPLLLKEHERDEERQWTPELESYAALMGAEDERPSGISGIDPAYFTTKAELIRRGTRVVEQQNRRIGAAR